MEEPLYDQKLSRAYVHGLTYITGPLHLHMEKTGFVDSRAVKGVNQMV